MNAEARIWCPYEHCWRPGRFYNAEVPGYRLNDLSVLHGYCGHCKADWVAV